ncbi:MAG: ABC transporter permease [Candidatus Aminicenantes bacterium]|jgi:ABC-type antimicrobial peptide transport system permease subunit
MFKNYLKVILRNIFSHKVYSLINILGLSIGITCSILIFLWVRDELRYDKFHVNADELFLVKLDQKYVSNVISSVTTTPGALGPALKREYPEILQYGRISSMGKVLLKYDRKIFYEKRFGLVDPSVFEMFTFPFVKGDPKTAFSAPHSVVITEEMAKKYFDDQEPLGKTLKLNHQYHFMVTGVIKNIPLNSSIRFDFFVPLAFFKELGREINQWKNDEFRTYVLMEKTASLGEVNKKIAHRLQKEIETKAEVFLHSFTQWHLHTENDGAAFIFVIVFSIVALLSLIIACINFINLSTARSANRAREIGLRKVVGANRMKLFKQFLGESIFIAFIAGGVSLIMVQLILPSFNNLANKQLIFDFSDMTMVLGFIGIIIFTGLVSGSYPALFLSSFKPISVLRGTLKGDSKSPSLRKILVVTQFSVSIILILTTIVVYRQLAYIQDVDLGFDKKNVVYISMPVDLSRKYENVKNELLQNPNVLNVTRAAELPAFIRGSSGGWDWEGKNTDEKIFMSEAVVGFDYIETFKMKMQQGRTYSKEFSTDKSEAIIINEEALKLMDIKSPLGKRLSLDGHNYMIIGVVKNYHYKPIYFRIKPLIIRLKHGPEDYMFVRINPTNASQTIDYLEKVYKTFSPGYPFEYGYVDEDNIISGRLKPIGQIILIFTILAIFVSCLGLLGLTSFTTEQRTKEIGVRKVFGASISDIVLILAKEFTKWVLIANVIGWIIAYLIMDQFLLLFAYRINLTFFMFLAATIFSLMIALLTISFQTVKAATRNPIYAIKYE